MLNDYFRKKRLLRIKKQLSLEMTSWLRSPAFWFEPKEYGGTLFTPIQIAAADRWLLDITLPRIERRNTYTCADYSFVTRSFCAKFPKTNL